MMIKKVLAPILRLVGVAWTENDWNAFFQFVKFSMVGVSNTIVSYLINISVLLMLKDVSFKYDYMIANITGFSLSVLWSYYWNSRLVFTLSKGENRSKWKTLLKTYASYGFTGFIVNNILSTVWIHGLGISKFIAPLFNIPFSMPINFFMNKLWAYKKSEG